MSSVLDLVAKITIDTTGFDAGLDKSKKKATGFGGLVKKGFGTLAGAATKAIAGAGAAVLAFGGASIKTGMNFDSAMSQVAATMGDNADKMVDYNGKSMHCASTPRKWEGLRAFQQQKHPRL